MGYGTLTRLFQRRSMRYGVPFILFMVCGSFGLREFSELRFKYNNNNNKLLRDTAEKMGIKMKKPGEVTLESEYEKMKKMDIDNWENKRIPRPWE